MITTPRNSPVLKSSAVFCVSIAQDLIEVAPNGLTDPELRSRYISHNISAPSMMLTINRFALIADSLRRLLTGRGATLHQWGRQQRAHLPPGEKLF
jgi:hypothetical protein